MHKKGIIQIPIDGLLYLIPAKFAHVGLLEFPLPPCQWCKCASLVVTVEEIQWGFDADKHTVICGCQECQNATIFEYELKHEEKKDEPNARVHKKGRKIKK